MNGAVMEVSEETAKNIEERNEKIVAAFEAGKKKTQIAREHKLTHQRVGQIIDKNRPRKADNGEPSITLSELTELFCEVTGKPMISVHPLHPEVVLPEQYTK